MFKFIQVLILLVFFCNPILKVNAATIKASSCSYSDVQAAINSASNGDTVLVPSGNCTWSSQLSFSKEIALEGAGIGITNITVDYADYVIKVLSADNWRITGFTFDGNNKGAAIVTQGGAKNFRIDHNKFVNASAAFITICLLPGYNQGVIDNNTFYNNRHTEIVVYGQGDSSWARPIVLGGNDEVVFVEDNTFTYDFCTTTKPPEHCISSNTGARTVFRYNTLNVCYASGNQMGAPIDIHGACCYSGDDADRGGVSIEVYENTLHSDHSYRCMHIRGGTGAIFNNILTGEFTYPIHLNNYRSVQSSCHEWCCWGSSDPSCGCCDCETGYPCLDQVNNLYIWNNTYNGNSVSAEVVSADCIPTHIQENRDFFHSQKPDYAPYTYPHPLTSGLSAPRLALVDTFSGDSVWIISSGKTFTYYLTSKKYGGNTVKKITEDVDELDETASVDLCESRSGSYFLDALDGTLYVHCTDGADPDAHTIRVYYY